MKPAVISLLLVASNAMALDFDTEWAKFSNDFARLRKQPVEKVEVTPLAPVVDADVKLVDPKSPERIGLSLSNPAMRSKMEKLYNKPNVVVYSTTLR